MKAIKIARFIQLKAPCIFRPANSRTIRFYNLKNDDAKEILELVGKNIQLMSRAFEEVHTEEETSFMRKKKAVVSMTIERKSQESIANRQLSQENSSSQLLAVTSRSPMRPPFESLPELS
jgi:Na+/phosphate symporter